MNDINDDPRNLLFKCRHCGFWPLAFVKVTHWSAESIFSCPRCKMMATFNTRPAKVAREEADANAGMHRR